MAYTRLLPGGYPGAASTISAVPLDLVAITQSAPNGRLSVQVFATRRGTLIADFTPWFEDGSFSSGEHGFETFTANIRLPLGEAARMMYRIRNKLAVVTDGAGAAWLGRVRGVTLRDSGLSLRCYGLWVALSDTLSTAFWSSYNEYSQWKQAGVDILSTGKPEKYELDNNNRLFIGLRKNEIYASGSEAGAWVYWGPYGTEHIETLTCDYVLFAPANWKFRLYTVTSGTYTQINSLTATGSLQTGTLNLAFTGGEGVVAMLFNEAGSPYTVTAESGVYHLRLTNIRLAASTNRTVDTTSSTAVALSVNTTIAAAITAGSGVTVTPASMTGISNGDTLHIYNATDGRYEDVLVTGTTGTTFTATFVNSYSGGAVVREKTAVVITPGSMTGIYVGQRLAIEAGHASNAESVEVTAVTGSTFTASFLKPHSAFFGIDACLVYANDVISQLLADIDAVNTGILSLANGFVNTHQVDILNLVYADARPADVINDLLKRPDPDSQLWEARIWEDAVLRFQPRGQQGRTWYVDVVSVELETSLDEVYNEVYETYQGSDNRRYTVAAVDDDYSINANGLTRQAIAGVGASTEAEAELYRDTYLADRAVMQVRARVETSGLFDATGGWRSPWQVRAGDTVVCRNLPPTFLGGALETIRRFRVGRTQFNFTQMRVEPETAIPSIEILIGRN